MWGSAQCIFLLSGSADSQVLPAWVALMPSKTVFLSFSLFAFFLLFFLSLSFFFNFSLLSFDRCSLGLIKVTPSYLNIERSHLAYQTRHQWLESWGWKDFPYLLTRQMVNCFCCWFLMKPKIADSRNKQRLREHLA